MAENNVDIDEMGMGADMEELRKNLAKLRKAGVKVSCLNNDLRIGLISNKKNGNPELPSFRVLRDSISTTWIG